MKNQKIIYDTFRCLSTGKKEKSCDILKGIKSILSNEKGYKDYIHKYTNLVNYPTFKTPGIDYYPLLKTQSFCLIPVKSNTVKHQQSAIAQKKTKTSNNENKIKSYINCKINSIINNSKSSLNDTTKSQQILFNKYKTRIIKYITLINEKNIKKDLVVGNKNVPRYNELFLDFFYKWSNANKNNSSMKINMSNISNLLLYQNSDLYNNSFQSKQNLKNEEVNKSAKEIIPKINDQYKGLSYDENVIFNTNYEKFILSKINYMKNNKIENFQKTVESTFDDLNGKQVKLKLKSIKLIITPNNKNNNLSELNKKNNFSMYLPLSYVFLFYYNNKQDFAKKVLMSLVHFENNYHSISFNDHNLYSLINTVDTSSMYNNHYGIENMKNFKREKKTGTSIYPEIDSSGVKPNVPRYKSLHIKKFILSSSLETSKLAEKVNDKIIKIVHSNKTLNDNIENNNKSNNNIMKNKENNYNEYYFLWETPIVTYKVKIEMPKIFFSYEGVNRKIMTFCDKNLFLFLFKKNFINWDYYVLNFMLSIKMLRKIILNFFAIRNNYTNMLSRYEDLLAPNNKNKNKIGITSNFIGEYEDDDEPVQENEKINSERINFDKITKKLGLQKDNDKFCIVLNHNGHKIYNELSENNETFTFFFTDNNLKNYLIHLYSYVIKVDYVKLNAKKHWEFYLNFKQMKYLNEVSKYESLSSFLPKIIKTNSENEQLIIDFSIFESNFNAKILSNTNSLNEENIKNQDLQLQIQKPYIEIEQIFKTSRIRGNIMKHVLEMDYLQYMNENKINNWSRKLLNLVGKYIDNDIRNPEKVANKLKNKNGGKNSLKGKNILRSSSQRFTYMDKGNKNNAQFIAELVKRKSKAFEV